MRFFFILFYTLHDMLYYCVLTNVKFIYKGQSVFFFDKFLSVKSTCVLFIDSNRIGNESFIFEEIFLFSSSSRRHMERRRRQHL